MNPGIGDNFAAFTIAAVLHNGRHTRSPLQAAVGADVGRGAESVASRLHGESPKLGQTEFFMAFVISSDTVVSDELNRTSTASATLDDGRFTIYYHSALVSRSCRHTVTLTPDSIRWVESPKTRIRRSRPFWVWLDS